MPVPLLVALPAAAGAVGFGGGFLAGNKTNTLLLYGAVGLFGYLVFTGKLKVTT